MQNQHIENVPPAKRQIQMNSAKTMLGNFPSFFHPLLLGFERKVCKTERSHWSDDRQQGSRAGLACLLTGCWLLPGSNELNWPGEKSVDKERLKSYFWCNFPSTFNKSSLATHSLSRSPSLPRYPWPESHHQLRTTSKVLLLSFACRHSIHFVVCCRDKLKVHEVGRPLPTLAAAAADDGHSFPVSRERHTTCCCCCY